MRINAGPALNDPPPALNGHRIREDSHRNSFTGSRKNWRMRRPFIAITARLTKLQSTSNYCPGQLLQLLPIPINAAVQSLAAGGMAEDVGGGGHGWEEERRGCRGGAGV